MRSALQQAANALLEDGKIDALSHGKYFKSLTEREIDLGLHGSSPDAKRPLAIAFLREIEATPPGPETSIYVEQQKKPQLDAIKDRINPDHASDARASRLI